MRTYYYSYRPRAPLPTLQLPPSSLPSSTRILSQFPFLSSNPSKNKLSFSGISATLNSPKGFGPAPKKKKQKQPKSDDEDDDDDKEFDRDEEGVIPEIITNRMMSRIGYSVGIPLAIGLTFFPFFYYLKVGLKIDVPTWVPFIVSFIFFGTALLGISYGIVSASWDPMREGSLLGWNEARKNWPVFWQSLRGGGGRSKNKS